MINHPSEILEEIERRRLELNLGLLKVYDFYRILVGLALLIVFTQNIIASRLGTLDPNWFTWVTITYITTNFFIALTIRFAPPDKFTSQYPAFALVVFDICALTWMMYLSGGVASGLGVLILVSMATGAIITTGRIATLLPAIATIAVLYEEFYLSLSAPALYDDFFQAGILGILYFAISLIIQNLSRRIRENDIRSLTQAAELADLERVNRQIVQRMRTGIVLVDRDNNVRMANQSARALLGQVQDAKLQGLPRKLRQHLNSWRADSHLRIPPFQAGQNTPEIKVNFSAVRARDNYGDVTIFIEDTGEIQQQAQQLKLAALGGLSANIAHEIRNPLGAISHAAQLLSESKNLDESDARFTDIIHDHCKRLNKVIENVLEMSRRKRPVPVRLELSSYLTEFAAGIKETASDAMIEVEVEPEDTQVRIDQSQLGQALANLVNNALRHSAEAGKGAYVRLEGGLDKRTDRPYLNVIDRGTGVAEEQLPKLFEPFFTTATSGTGLGLYISREICEANQARLTYYPHDSGGSCFRITFAHPDRITA